MCAVRWRRRWSHDDDAAGFVTGSRKVAAVNENFLINSLVLCTCCHVLIVSNGCPKRIPQAPSKVFVVRRRKSTEKGKQKEGKVPNLLIYLMCVLWCCGKFFSVHPSANFVSIVLQERDLNKNPIASPSPLHENKVFTDGKHLSTRKKIFVISADSCRKFFSLSFSCVIHTLPPKYPAIKSQ